jgi:hypothetical protein
MDFVKYRPLQATHRTDLYFDRPIFDWTGVIPKFFGMIFTAVGAQIPINAKEFSVIMPTNVGEVQGRYNVYGGPSSFSIFADKVAADFPVLTPADFPLVKALLKAVHDAFAVEFPNFAVSRVETISSEHIEILPPHTVKEFLARHQTLKLEQSFGLVEAIIEPAIKFTVKGAAQPWRFTVMYEQSLLHAAALFVSESLTVNDANKLPTFEDKVALGIRVEQLTLKALGLERADGPET